MAITGATLLVTADTDTILGGGENPQGSPTLDNVGRLTISVEILGGSGLVTCSALVGENVTRKAMGACDFTEHVGKEGLIHIGVDGSALLYMIGFA